MITYDLNHDLLFYYTQSILCATVDSQFLEYLGYVTLFRSPVLPQDGGIIYVSHVFYIVSAQM